MAVGTASEETGRSANLDCKVAVYSRVFHKTKKKLMDEGIYTEDEIKELSKAAARAACANCLPYRPGRAD